MISDKRARRLMRLSHVRRWAAIPTLQKQSVAEHSFNVTIIAMWLCQFHQVSLEYSELEAMPIMVAALIHDEAEALSGDIDATFKQTSGINPQLKDFEHRHGLGAHSDKFTSIVKLADKLEALLFVDTEIGLGNTTLGGIRYQLAERVQDEWENRFEHRLKSNVCCGIEAAFLEAFNPGIHPAMEGPHAAPVAT